MRRLITTLSMLCFAFTMLTAQTTVFIETFDDGLGQFENDASNGIDWTQDEAGSIINKYGDDNTNLLTSTEIELAADNMYQLSFDHTPYTEANCDYAHVYLLVKQEDESWGREDITTYYQGGITNFTGHFDYVSYKNEAISTETYNLTTYAGKTVKIQFELISDESCSYEDDDWYWLISQVTVTSAGEAASYTLSFDTGDTSITIESGTYLPTLPLPVKDSYYFDGWYIDDTEIKEGGSWSYTENKTATAHWVSSEGFIFYESFYENGLGQFENEEGNTVDWTQDDAGSIINKYGNYNTNLLTSTEIELAADYMYQLSFDHTPYTENNYDYAYVYLLVKEDDGSWSKEDITAYYTGAITSFPGYFNAKSYGEVEATETFDLTMYRGKTIKIQYLLTSDSGINYDNGYYWSISRVTVENSGVIINTTLSFDSDDTTFNLICGLDSIPTLPIPEKDDYYFNGWYIDDTEINEGDLWNYTEDQIATANWVDCESTIFFESFYNGTGQFVCDDSNGTAWTQNSVGSIINLYNNNDTTLLTSNEIELVYGNSYQLSFIHTYVLGSSDYGYIYVLVKGDDDTWSKEEITNYYEGEQDSFYGFYSNATDHNGEQITDKFSLNAFMGKTIKLEFKIATNGANYYTSGNYWEINQVEIENRGSAMHTLSFDTDDTPITVVEGASIPTLPVPETESYYFDGWYIDDTLIEEGDTWSYTEDKTAVAQWIIIPTFFETFDDGLGQFVNEEGNGVDWTQDAAGSIINKYGESNTNLLTSSEFELEYGSGYQLTFDHIPYTESGYDFAYVYVLVKEADGSWSTTDITNLYQGGITDFKGYFNRGSYSGQQTVATETFNLAAFTGKTIKIQFKLTSDDDTSYEDGGYYWSIYQVKVEETGALSSYTLSFDTEDTPIELLDGSSIPTLPVPQMDGYYFDGWYIDDTKITEGDYWSYTEDKTAVAQWIAVAFAETFDDGLGQFVNEEGNTVDWTQDEAGSIINKYGDKNTNLLTSCEFELEYGSGYLLTFDHTPYTETNYDFAYVYVLVKEADGSWSTTDITSLYQGEITNYNGYFNRASYNYQQVVATETFNLAAFTGKTIKIQFKLTSDNGASYESSGYYWSIYQVMVENTGALPSYTLSFDTEDTPIEVVEGSFIPTLPIPQKDSYYFDGWYIDDIKIVEGDIWSYTEGQTATASWISTEGILFFESFYDDGLGQFVNEEGNSTNWVQNVTGSIINMYGDYNTSRLTSNEIELENAKGYLLSFQHTAHLQGEDYAAVSLLVKEADGSWSTVDITNQYIGSLENYLGTFSYYSYQDTEVVTEMFNLAPFNGRTIKIEFKLTSDDDKSYSNGFYWSIDQVKVAYSGAMTSYTLSFDTEDAAIDIAKGEYMHSLPTPTKEDYLFDGWYIDDVLVAEGTIWEYEENKTAVAHWIDGTDVVFYESFYNGMGQFENDESNGYYWTINTAGSIINKYGTTSTNLLTSSEFELEFGNKYQLTFDHIPNIGGGDYAYVYLLIKQSDDSWSKKDITALYQGAIRNYAGYFSEDSYSDNVLVTEIFDLTMYSGCTVKIQFELITDTNSSYFSDGYYWSIDQVMVTNTGEIMTYTLSFDTDDASISIVENGEIPTLPIPEKDGYYFNGWYIDDTQIKEGDKWSYGEDKTAVAAWIDMADIVFFETFNDGLGEFENDEENDEEWTQDAAGSIINKYGDDNINLLTSSEMTLEQGSGYELTFAHTPYTESNYDLGYVYVLVKGEDGSWSTTNIANYYSGDAIEYEGFFDADSYDYSQEAVTERFDLSVFMGKTIKVQFKLTSDESVSYSSDGYYWEIFDVMVRNIGEVVTYTLSFDTGDTPITVVENLAIGTLPTPEKEDYYFYGWQIDGTSISKSTVWRYTEDKTATAYWMSAEDMIFFETFDDGLGQFENDESNGTAWVQNEVGSIVNLYGNDNVNLLTSTEIELPEGYNYQLTFNHTPYTERDDCDYAYVYLLVKEGDDSWSKEDITAYYRGSAENFYGYFDEDTYRNEEVATEDYLLNAYSGKTIKIVFELETDGSVSYEDGYDYYWLITDVRIACTGVPTPYTLSFDTGDTAITVYEDVKITNLPIPEKEGYYFDGWYIDGIAIYNSTVWSYTEDKAAESRWFDKDNGLFYEPFDDGLGQFENDEYNSVAWVQETAGSIVNNYGDDNENLLTSIEIEMPNDGKEYKLYFNHTPYTEQGCDLCFVSVLVKEDEETWSEEDITGYYEGEYPYYDGYFDEECYDNEEISTEVFDLSAFVGKTFKLQFLLSTDGSVSYEDGYDYYWLLDQVMIRTTEVVSGTGQETATNTAVYGTEAGIVIHSTVPNTVAVYNVVGSLVANKALTDSSTLISVPSGVYIVRVENTSYKVIVK